MCFQMRLWLSLLLASALHWQVQGTSCKHDDIDRITTNEVHVLWYSKGSKSQRRRMYGCPTKPKGG